MSALLAVFLSACTAAAPSGGPVAGSAGLDSAVQLAGQDSAAQLSALSGGKPMLVWFTNFCPEACHGKARRFQKLQGKLGVQVVAVADPSLDAAAIARLRGELAFDFPVVLDPEGALGRAWDAPVTHDTCPYRDMFVLDPAFTVRYVGDPGTSDAELEREFGKLGTRTATGSRLSK